jgi:2'-5' RNA ligase
VELRPDNRLFVALEPRPEARARLARMAELIAARTGGRPVSQGRIHLTLTFIGRTPSDQVAGLSTALAERLFGPPLRGRARELRSRPSGRAARLVALSLTDESGRLTAAMSAAAAAVAAALEHRDDGGGEPWPHVTLVRYRSPTRLPRRLLADLAAPVGTLEEQVFDFDRASLYDSEQQRGGPPRYRPVATFPLD